MQFKVFSVKDTKVGSFSYPFYKNTQAEAEREFVRLARDPKTNVNQFPEDYDLYHLGTFDLESGMMQPLEKPVCISQAAALVRRDIALAEAQPTA